MRTFSGYSKTTLENTYILLAGGGEKALSGLVDTTTALTISGTKTFNNKIVGNIDTADSWNTARTLTIGNTGKLVNGSADVSWSLSEIGAAAASHTHPYLPLSGGTMVGTISAANDAYGGGGFNNGYANIILRGNTTTGTSGIVFSSSKGDTSINRPSDCAFIQFLPYGVSAATAVGTNPTINTSGEAGRFVIGIHNDSGDQLWLQTSAANDLKHVVGANVYTIYDSGNLPAYPTKASWNYDDRYLRYYRYSSSDTPNANSLSDGWHDAHVAITNAPTTNHGTLILNSYNGTPFQIFIPDASYYIYKRYNTGSIGGTWTKISAGYADSAGAVAWTNITSKPEATGGATTPVYWNGSGFTNCTAYESASVNYATSAGSTGTLSATSWINGSTSELPHLVWHIPNTNWGNLSMNASGEFFFRKTNNTSESYANLYANLPDYAKLGAHNNLTASTNEFTFASSGFSGAMYINYRTAGGTNGNITSYLFCKGNMETLATLDSTGTILTSSNWSNYISNSGGGSTNNTTLLTNNTTQAGNACYDANPGLHFYRYSGDDNTIGGGDGWIMQWSWNPGSVGGLIYLDDNPSGIIGIRGCTGSSGTAPTGFTSWWKLYSDNYHPSADYATSAGAVAWDNVSGKPTVVTNPYTGHVQITGRVFGYNYGNQGNNAVAFMWDKPGNYYTGMGPNGVADLIHFGPCNGDGTWVSEYSLKWDFQGNVYASNFYTTSDLRKKNIISGSQYKVEDFAKIPLINFEWRDKPGEKLIGTIAQSVQAIIPELVTGEEYLSVNYGVLGALAGVEACKEIIKLRLEIKELKLKLYG